MTDISVIIPHLNQPEQLARCLASLRAQKDAPDFEIIVVDNGSAVQPEGICAEYGAVLLREATPGPGPARNRGAAAARGDVLAFIDADCLADSGWLAAIRDALADPALAVLGGDVRIAYENPDDLTVLEAYESIYAYRMDLYIRRDGFTGTGNLAVRRDVFEKIGPFGGIGIAEDIDWGRRAGAMGRPPVWTPSMRVYHPARRSFDDLRHKWDRHVAHFYEENRGKPLWWPRWMAKTCAVAGSPALEAVTILRSDRVTGTRARLRALRGVARIRLYRARKMLSLAMGATPESLSGAWNRD